MTPVEQRLKERIRAEGPIPFADFMEEALYGIGGYYNREDLAIGEEGDFVTGSSHSPLFAEVTARLLRRLDAVVDNAGGADYLEVGYGNGLHLAALGRALDKTDRALLAWDRVRRPVPPGFERIDDLGHAEVDGLVFSYELFDALPVHRLIQRPEGLGEMWVGVSEGSDFEWRMGDLSSPELMALPGHRLEEGQIADLAPGWRPLYRRLAEALGRGLLVTFDYGFEVEKLLDTRVRRHGTLACYRRHRVHRDPFVSVGEQDMTAHVDFSALIEEGERAGLETVVLSRQAAWLAALGLLGGLEERPAAERVAAMQLVDLEGMGEEIRVLVQARGVDLPKVLPRELL
ncbi:MAG: SAM-dependent methyltransferase [Acidobacteriota bacterium]|nr:SAM-dependent methyltransferase [Acidobacteriota bacterium]